MQYFDPTTTAVVYERPDNGYREAEPRLAWLWMLLFGIIYLAIGGLWRDFTIWLVLFILLIAVAWPLAICAAFGPGPTMPSAPKSFCASAIFAADGTRSIPGSRRLRLPNLAAASRAASARSLIAARSVEFRAISAGRNAQNG